MMPTSILGCLTNQARSSGVSSISGVFSARADGGTLNIRIITNSNKRQREGEANRLRKEPGPGTSTAGAERSIGLIHLAHMSRRVKEKDDVSFLMNSTSLLVLFDQAASAFLPSLCPNNVARGLAETP